MNFEFKAEDFVRLVEILSVKEGIIERWNVLDGDCVLKGQIMGKYQDNTDVFVCSTVNGIVRKLEKEGETYQTK